MLLNFHFLKILYAFHHLTTGVMLLTVYPTFWIDIWSRDIKDWMWMSSMVFHFPRQYDQLGDNVLMLWELDVAFCFDTMPVGVYLCSCFY